jgi:hypothetical protein
MLFWLEARGDIEGEAMKTGTDGDSTHAKQGAEAQAQIDPQREDAETITGIDKTEV